jgi:predicted nicotinamide N-methyase
VSSAPDIVCGRRVRLVEVEVVPGMCVQVLEAADADVVLEESIREEGDAYAAVLWPSAIAAAARLPGLVRPGMHVLDLGAGTGIVAITAARLGARATAVDHDVFARAVIAESARLSDVDVALSDFDVVGETPLPPADIIVIADLLYEPELARAAARRTLEALAAGATVLVGDPARFARAEYARVLHDAGLDVRFDDVLIRVPGEPVPARVGLALIGGE